MNQSRLRAAMLRRGAAFALGLAVLAGHGVARAGDTPLGYWQALEPSEGTTTIIEFYREGDALAGRVVRVLDARGDELARRCARCPGELAGRALAGLRFVWGLHERDGRWTGGKVIDLRDGLTQGTVANVELDVSGNTLDLHAWLGLRALGQSRRWQRLPPPQAAAPQTPAGRGLRQPP